MHKDLPDTVSPDLVSLPLLLQAQTAAQSASDNTWGTETWSLTSDDLDLEAVVYEKHTLR